jgi:hypothetical protein
MLQTCDVGIRVEEESSSCWMLHATRVATWSQYSRNMVATLGEEGGGSLIFGCCTQHARNMARNGAQHACNIVC